MINNPCHVAEDSCTCFCGLCVSLFLRLACRGSWSTRRVFSKS